MIHSNRTKEQNINDIEFKGVLGSLYNHGYGEKAHHQGKVVHCGCICKPVDKMVVIVYDIPVRIKPLLLHPPPAMPS